MFHIESKKVHMYFKINLLLYLFQQKIGHQIDEIRINCVSAKMAVHRVAPYSLI